MIFPNLILRFLFGFSTLCFAAGTVAITDGGGGAEAAGDGDGALDDGAGAGDGDGGAGDGSEVVDDGSQADGSQSDEGTDSQQQGDKPGDDKIDWRTVPQAVRSHLQEIKKTDPKLANLLQNAVYTSQTILKAVPGGLKEIQALKQAVDDAGGVEEIQTLRETHRAVIEEQEEMDRRAASGDVSVLDNLVDIAGDSGFSKLMPSALDRWMQKDPAQYSHAIGQIMVSAMQEGGVVADMNLAFKMLGLGTPDALKIAQEAMQNIAKWANGIGEIAAKAPEKPKVDPQIEASQKALDDREAALFNKEFSSEFVGWRNPLILKKLDDMAPKGKTFSDYQKGIFVRGIVEAIREVQAGDGDYDKSLQRIYGTRNKGDLLKFTKARFEKLLNDEKGPAKRIYRELFTETTLGGKPQPKPGAQAGKQPPKPGAQPGAQPANKGWVKVTQDKAPAPDQIDLKQSPFEMRIRKAAILKNGQKVYWGERPPA